MTLTPRQVLGVAAHSGWPVDAQRDAVAVALAFSGGDPARTSSAPLVPPVAYVGLWGVPLTVLRVGHAVDLTDPAHNAKVAYLLWERAGETWDWQPAFMGPAWPAALTLAGDAVRAGALPLGVSPSAPYTAPVWDSGRTVRPGAALDALPGMIRSKLRP